MLPDRDVPGGRPVLRAAAAAVIYLALALWSLPALLPAPSTTTTLPVGFSPNAIGDADLAAMVWTTARNARTLVTHPLRLHEFETCYPTPRGAGFGAPYFMDGLLVLPAYLLGAPPILAYNFEVLLALWLSAVAMFLLVDHWTRDFGAALLAGIAFGFHPARILGAHWPHVYGNEWTPLVLLFTHRLFARSGWRDAAGLAVFLGLQILGCFYQFLPLVVIEGAYVLTLAYRYRGRLPALVPKLLLVVAAAVACGAVQFFPALHVQRTWGTLSGRFNIAEPFGRFLPGGPHHPGIVVLLLVVVALVDRIRARRTVPRDDPRLVLFVSGLLVVWTVVFSLPVPGTSMRIPSLLGLVGKTIPGLSSALAAVRGIQFGHMGVYVCSAALAGFGVAALRRGRSPVTSRALAVGLVGALLTEVYVPAVAVRSFSNAVDLEAHVRGLDPAVTELERRTLHGPVLDLPAVAEGIGALFPNSHAIMLATFHQQPVAACYNSFVSPLSKEVSELANRLPEIQAAEDLHALGFQYVVVHGDVLGPYTQLTLSRLRGLQMVARLLPLGTAPDHWVFRLQSPVAVSTDLAALAPADETSPPQVVAPPSADVAFPFRNGRSVTYRHPDPIEPSEVVLRWYDAAGAPASEAWARTLLPIALVSGEEKRRTLRLSIPAAAGAYRVTLARASAPEQVLAVAHVQVTAAP